MPKTITCPIKRYEGTVVLPDALTWPQYLAYKEAASDMPEDFDLRVFKFLPAVLACVTEWHLKNVPVPVTVDNFPASPHLSAAQLLGWLIHEVTVLVQDEESNPPA